MDKKVVINADFGTGKSAAMPILKMAAKLGEESTYDGESFMNIPDNVEDLPFDAEAFDDDGEDE